MQSYFIWLIIGLVLAIAEMATGTFYLLVLGITAFVAALVAYLGGSFTVQVLVAVVVGIVGCVWVSVRRKHAASAPMRPLDVGQPVIFDAWMSERDSLARVRYRDALWDAQISGERRGEAGEVFYIIAVRGSRLEVSKQRT